MLCVCICLFQGKEERVWDSSFFQICFIVIFLKVTGLFIEKVIKLASFLTFNLN